MAWNFASRRLLLVDGALYAIGGCTTALCDSPVVERRRLAGALTVSGAVNTRCQAP